MLKEKGPGIITSLKKALYIDREPAAPLRHVAVSREGKKVAARKAPPSTVRVDHRAAGPGRLPPHQKLGERG